MKLKTQSLNRILLFLVFFLSTAAIYFISVVQIKAACKVDDFHTLRPCPGDPINDTASDLALFCGNDLLVKREVSANRSEAVRCETTPGGKEKCFFRVSGTTPIAIDLSGAEFPIAGNTELVRNEIRPGDELDDSQKVNEYVSWYLNGLVGRGEYGAFDPEDPEDIRKITSFSGPVQKLLPWNILLNQRSETVEKAVRKERYNQVVGCITLAGGIVQCPDGIKVRLSTWKNDLPPKEEDYDKFIDFWLDYKRWLGDICVSFLGVNACLDNPLSFRYPGNLFSFIPLSSTEDRVGEVATESVASSGGGVNVVSISFDNQEPAKLFVPHMEELRDLASLLQDTFVAQGEARAGGGTGAARTDYCDLAQIRTNPGDNLFAGEIKGDLSYTAEFDCNFDAGAGGTCTKDIFINLQVVTKTPLVDNAWERFVIGPASIVKRIFPKVGAGSAIEAFLDIPGATKVTYSGEGLIQAGNPGNDRDGSSAELYFPHLGGISEYLLKGIQTALRPKGYGEPILSGQAETLEQTSGDINCNQNAPEASLSRILGVDAMFQLALNWVGGQTGNHVKECYNDVVAKAKGAGVNVALTFWVWLHESGASNYNLQALDFGVITAPPQDFNSQISGFLSTAQAYASPHPSCPPGTSAMESFAYLYSAGTCDSGAPIAGTDQTAGDFYDEMVNEWSWITSCPFPKSPTDTSCP